jgi:hypothetical protein
MRCARERGRASGCRRAVHPLRLGYAKRWTPEGTGSCRRLRKDNAE